MIYRVIRPLTVCIAAVIGAAGCVGTTALSTLDQSHPIGDPFSQQLYKNYAFLARSFGDVGTPTSGSPFDVGDSIHLGSVSLRVADVANAFAEKAITAAQGDEVLPEPPPAETPAAEAVRLRLLRALDQGREKAPARAARAQADYDCWALDSRADLLRKAAQECRRSLDTSLAMLESDVSAAPAAVAATAPTSGS